MENHSHQHNPTTSSSPSTYFDGAITDYFRTLANNFYHQVPQTCTQLCNPPFKEPRPFRSLSGIPPYDDSDIPRFLPLVNEYYLNREIKNHLYTSIYPLDGNPWVSIQGREDVAPSKLETHHPSDGVVASAPQIEASYHNHMTIPSAMAPDTPAAPIGGMRPEVSLTTTTFIIEPLVSEVSPAGHLPNHSRLPSDYNASQLSAIPRAPQSEYRHYYAGDDTMIAFSGYPLIADPGYEDTNNFSQLYGHIPENRNNNSSKSIPDESMSFPRDVRNPQTRNGGRPPRPSTSVLTPSEPLPKHNPIGFNDSVPPGQFHSFAPAPPPPPPPGLSNSHIGQHLSSRPPESKNGFTLNPIVIPCSRTRDSPRRRSARRSSSGVGTNRDRELEAYYQSLKTLQDHNAQPSAPPPFNPDQQSCTKFFVHEVGHASEGRGLWDSGQRQSDDQPPTGNFGLQFQSRPTETGINRCQRSKDFANLFFSNDVNDDAHPFRLNEDKNKNSGSNLTPIVKDPDPWTIDARTHHNRWNLPNIGAETDVQRNHNPLTNFVSTHNEHFAFVLFPSFYLSPPYSIKTPFV